MPAVYTYIRTNLLYIRFSIVKMRRNRQHTLITNPAYRQMEYQTDEWLNLVASYLWSKGPNYEEHLGTISLQFILDKHDNPDCKPSELLAGDTRFILRKEKRSYFVRLNPGFLGCKVSMKMLYFHIDQYQHSFTSVCVLHYIPHVVLQPVEDRKDLVVIWDLIDVR